MTVDPTTTTPSLPPGFSALRPHQEVAIDQILNDYSAGADVEFLDAPTGTGKTLIGEMIRRHLNVPTLYVCSDKQLMAQFARDFPFAKLLKGRSNYPTQSNPDATALDCTAQRWDDPCWHCDGGKPECPYEIAKYEALRAPLAVTNTAYLLHEANYVGKFSGRELVICDEADTLEKIMMGFVEYRVPARLIGDAGLVPPRKGVHKPKLIEWLADFYDALKPLAINARQDRDFRRFNYIRAAAQNAARVGVELQRDIDARGSTDEDTGMWLREYHGDLDADGLTLRPVMVSGYGSRNLWRHGRKWLLMSATIISADEMADSLGLPLDYATTIVPMTFPVENREIILAPIANMIYKEMTEGDAKTQMAYAIRVAADKHPDDRIMVHTVSYQLARDLEKLLKSGPEDCRLKGRRIVTYTEGRGRDQSLQQYLQSRNGVMLAPSMSRGIDLADDACRVQIIAKVPFLALNDRVTKARMYLPGGQLWYTVQAIRDIVQMTGRGVRHEEDWCVTYIFDAQFGRNLWSKWKRLFPAWWRDAVRTNVDVREFIRR